MCLVYGGLLHMPYVLSMMARFRDEDGAAQDLLESKLTGIWDAVR